MTLHGLNGYWNSHISVCKFANLQNPNLQICKFGRQFANLDASLQTLGALVFKYLRGVKMHPAEVHFCALGGVPARVIPKSARRP